MEKPLDQVMSELNGIVCGVLRHEAIKLEYETTAKDVPGWDSLNHVEIVVAAEKHFKIRFNFFELQKFKNVGQMCDSIVAKLARGK